FFFSSRRRHTRFSRDWSSDVCSSDLQGHLTISVTDESRASLVERLQLFGAAQEKGLPDLLLPGLLRSPWPLEEPGLSPLEEVLRSEERRVGRERILGM